MSNDVAQRFKELLKDVADGKVRLREGHFSLLEHITKEELTEYKIDAELCFLSFRDSMAMYFIGQLIEKGKIPPSFLPIDSETDNSECDDRQAICSIYDEAAMWYRWAIKMDNNTMAMCQLANLISKSLIAPTAKEVEQAIGNLRSGSSEIAKSASPKLREKIAEWYIGKANSQKAANKAANEAANSRTPPDGGGKEGIFTDPAAGSMPDSPAGSDSRAFERVVRESRLLAENQGNIGPRSIPGWKLHDVRDDGNCFYKAVVHQMTLIHHSFLSEVPGGTQPHDVLRSRIQGRGFNDGEWADHPQICALVCGLNLTIAIVDTRHPASGYVYHYMNMSGRCNSTTDRKIFPDSQIIIKLAYTGNHYLSVLQESPSVNQNRGRRAVGQQKRKADQPIVRRDKKRNTTALPSLEEEREMCIAHGAGNSRAPVSWSHFGRQNVATKTQNGPEGNAPSAQEHSHFAASFAK